MGEEWALHLSLWTGRDGQVETLSGFANGTFLVLISVFIVFEAVQRLLVSFLILISSGAYHLCRLDPPEMNTNQLLLVSSVGLGVNLFGMFAMGGRHHVRMPSLGLGLGLG
jgi:zinc transporter 5/7